MNKLVVCDIDDTIAIRNGSKDYSSDFVSKMKPNTEVVSFLKSLDNVFVNFVTGRSNDIYAPTMLWLIDNISVEFALYDRGLLPHELKHLSKLQVICDLFFRKLMERKDFEFIMLDDDIDLISRVFKITSIIPTEGVNVSFDFRLMINGKIIQIPRN